MMHPDTELRLINQHIGFGVFATRFIPRGTVVYAKDALDIQFDPAHPLITDALYATVIEKYTYIEPDGVRVLSWDHARYVNHSCTPSTLTTGYGFEIALRDLQPGDELTDDYTIFNSAEAMTCCCGTTDCRSVITASDFDRMVPSWDSRIRRAIRAYDAVRQPLESLIPSHTLEGLHRFLSTGRGYRSIATQKLTRRIDEQPHSARPRSEVFQVTQNTA